MLGTEISLSAVLAKCVNSETMNVLETDFHGASALARLRV